MIVDLPYPDKLLWPNGRTRSPQAKARKVKDHRGWATSATWSVHGTQKVKTHPERVAIKIVVSGRPRGPLPDKDGASAAAKAYLDGIADALGINDQHFDAPVVEFDTARKSRFYIEVVL